MKFHFGNRWWKYSSSGNVRNNPLCYVDLYRTPKGKRVFSFWLRPFTLNVVLGSS